MASHDPLVVSNTYLFGFPPHGRARSVRAIDGEGAAHRQHLPTSFLVSRPVNEVRRVTVQGFRQPSRPIPGHPPELFKPDAPAISDTWKRSAKGRTNSRRDCSSLLRSNVSMAARMSGSSMSPTATGRSSAVVPPLRQPIDNFGADLHGRPNPEVRRTRDLTGLLKSMCCVDLLA